ncbi:hypothetical protein CspeluHIS016_0700590 [Cutaneotrichosporon spelunceum]|uniref:Peptidase A1 domain-containing protein n=1 Tax=Cutaneotrichosporon spelunceum TaxID=1672016 RepID=A0AAD3TYU8_9TREE|nr:hypothetical protein CspeluHIS016_0700590 [Cutaneotrichosporon spelunceum]
MPVAVLILALAVATAAQVLPLTPTLTFNLTLSPLDGFQTFSTDEWDIVNLTSGSVAARTLMANRAGEGQMWVNGPFCTAVRMEGESAPHQLQLDQSSPAPVTLALDTTATVNSGANGTVVLAAGGAWHYCAPRVDVNGIDFTLYNMTITTGMVAAVSSLADVPLFSQSLLDDHDSLNTFFHFTSPGGSVNWIQQNGANVLFDTSQHSVIATFDMPYSTAFFYLYGSVGPDHSDLDIRFDPPLPGVPAGSAAGIKPVRSVGAQDRLLFVAPVDPNSRYKVIIPLRKGQVQALSRVEFLSGLGITSWPVDPTLATGLGGHQGLSGGAIAGIVIGALALLFALLAAFIYRSRRKTRRATQRWSDVKLRRMLSPQSPPLSPPRDVKTQLPFGSGSGSGLGSEVSPPQPAHTHDRPSADLNNEPHTPWPWTERPGPLPV